YGADRQDPGRAAAPGRRRDGGAQPRAHADQRDQQVDRDEAQCAHCAGAGAVVADSIARARFITVPVTPTMIKPLTACSPRIASASGVVRWSVAPPMALPRRTISDCMMPRASGRLVRPINRPGALASAAAPIASRASDGKTTRPFITWS